MVTENDERNASNSTLQSKKLAYRQKKFTPNSIQGIVNLPQMNGLPSHINGSENDNRSRNPRAGQSKPRAGNSLESSNTMGGSTIGYNPKSPVNMT